MSRQSHTSQPTAKDAAQLMTKLCRATGVLTQKRAVRELQDAFGDHFVYKNENNHNAIDLDVLSEFRKQNPDSVWSNGGKKWRPRIDTDKPGRGQR